MKMIESNAKHIATFKKKMTSLIKEAHKLSITAEEHVVILVYSPSGNPYFYDSSYNFNTIDTFLDQNLENIVVDPDDMKAYTIH
ncbi:hypothetical protein R3W88_024128 [Solanum pinnatisectum]|uniref:MADS-box domain-containing protein n=1 Tax=Solanum pinnatisectum TaxID=50273 RepID=A0AAV9LZE2_9SOLN|nr:hypothetical protein R3W88_024128 [Solanum pinnatisectum]